MTELQAWITTWLDPRVVGAAAMDWSGRIFAALVIFIVGRLLMRGVTTYATAGMRRVGIDDTLSRFLGNLLYMVLLLFLALAVFGTLGVPTTNFLAIVGAAGLAVGSRAQGFAEQLLVGRHARVLPAVQGRRSDRRGWRRRCRREHRHLQRR